MSRRASYTTTKRRASVTLITASHNSEEDITKTILSVKKAPSSISKRRGSTVSISDSLNSNSRNNSIVMIEEQASSLLPNLKPFITQTTTATTSPVIVLEDETKISLDQMDTGEFIRPDYELKMPPPILQHRWGENGESCHNYYEDEDDDDDDDYDEEDVLLPLPENDASTQPTSKNQQSHKKSLSAPIPCLAHDRPLVPSVNYDNHTQYKQRAQMSSKKLTNFFGDKPPIDISIREIEKEGLKAMLQSKIPLCYFLYSLLEEYSCENLFFFLEVERYESCKYPNASQQLVAAQRIFDTYLTRNSQFEVNIDDRVRKSVVSAIKSPRDPTHCFDEAKRAIFVLLEVSFARFIRSETAEMMKRDISENTMQYSVRARNAAVSLLFRFLERHGCSDIKQQDFLILVGDHYEKNKSLLVNENLPIPSPTSTTSQRRYELVRMMTLTFLRTMVGIDMENYQHYISRKRSNERINEKNSEVEEYEWDDALGQQQRRKNPFRRHASKNSLKIK